MSDGVKYKVSPSELHAFAYCPRRYFFEINLQRRRGIRDLLRLLLGRLFHAVKGLSSKARGYAVEEAVEVIVGRVRITGRTDAFRVVGETLEVVERKSGRAPKGGAWVSDVLQASTYAVALARQRGVKEARIRVEYRDRSHTYVINDDLVALTIRAIDDLVLVKYHGIVPYPRRSPRRCASCPFRSICEELDKNIGADGEIYEPGSWLERISLIPPEQPKPEGESLSQADRP